MWEITLVGKPNDIGFFLELRDFLKIKLGKEVIIVISIENNLLCSIALSNKKEISFVKKYVFETIIKIIKTEIYESRLTIFTDDKSLNAFMLSSLVMINLKDEVDYAIEFTKLSKIIHISSFVNFKLKKLIEIWLREINYYNVIFNSYPRDDLYLEILRFLAQNSIYREEVIYLEENNDKMLILDNHKNAIKKISKRDEIGIIVQLIMYCPKKIIINCFSSLSDKVSSLISYIFEDRVSLLL